MRFLEKKKKLEEGLAQDILNQFMQEVVKEKDKQATEAHHLKGAWAKKAPSPLILKSKDDPPKPTGSHASAGSPTLVIPSPDKVQGKWRERLQQPKPNVRSDQNIAVPDHNKPSSPSSYEKKSPNRQSQQTALSSGESEDRPAIVEAVEQLIQTKSVFSDESGMQLKPDQPSERSDALSKAREAKRSGNQPGSPQNKWSKKPPGSGVVQHKVPGQTAGGHSAANNFVKPSTKRALLSNALEKGVEKGGNAKQILKAAVKKIENEDPALAMKAQEFFFEKIGAALLNNFKNNLVPCACCGRKFDQCSLA